MNIGHGLVANDGYLNLQKETVYYFLVSSDSLQRVLLVEFQSAAKHVCFLHSMSRLEFEGGLQNGALVARPNESSLPPWLSADLQGTSVQRLDEMHPRRKTSYRHAIDQRYEQIKPLLADASTLLSLEDPSREIGRRARSLGLNTSRAKFWFYSQYCFPHELALCPVTSNKGVWDRKAKARKFGRPSKLGRSHGFAMTKAMEDMCETGYYEFCVKGRTKTEIYNKALRNVFGCRSATDKFEKAKLFHPTGKPWPSSSQFWYVISKRVGRDTDLRMRLGDHHIRQVLAPSEGRYSEGLCNALQWVQMDGQYAPVIPAGLLPGETLPPFIQVRAICATTGAQVGVGFGLGSESSAPYRMALFSMAVGLPKYFEIFGLDGSKVADLRGFSSRITVDRGTGRIYNFRNPDESALFATELTRSYDGQGKASVEARHTRHRDLHGPPEYKVSAHNPILLARAALLQAACSNRVSDATARLTDDMIKCRIEQSPAGVFNHLLQRGRTDGFQMPFAQAVRTFLTPVKIKLHNDGAWLLHRRYDSPALRATGILRKVATSRAIEFQGYMVDLSLRKLWLDVQGQIVELDAQMPIADYEDDLYISYAELCRLDELRREDAVATKEHRDASRVAAEEQFERDTGCKFDGERTRSGRAPSRKSRKRSASADLDILMPGRKVA